MLFLVFRKVTERSSFSARWIAANGSEIFISTSRIAQRRSSTLASSGIEDGDCFAHTLKFLFV